MNTSPIVRAVRAQMYTASKPWTLVMALGGAAAISAAPVVAEPLMDDDGFEIEVPVQTFREVNYTSSYEFGLGFLSEDAIKFGEYNSMDRQGLYLIGNIDLLQRSAFDADEGAPYMQLRGRNLGTDSRELDFETGRQGDYRARFSIDQTEKQVSHSFVTPFDTSDPGSLTLPAGWVGLNTIADQFNPTKPAFDPVAGQDNLDSNATLLRSMPLSTRRDSFAVGVQNKLQKGWSVTADVKREYKTGEKDYGFYAGVPMIVPEPVDYVTDQFTVGVEHATKSYQYQLNYYLSQFSNNEPVLKVVSAGNGGANAMQLPPDNSFQQLTFNGNYRFTPATRGTLYTSYSKGKQDEELLPLSAKADNAAIDPTAPTKADIDRDTLIVQAGLSSRLTRDFTLSAKYRYEDSDNKLEEQTYSYALLEGGAAWATVSTFEMDTKKQRLNLDGALRLPRGSKLKLGYQLEEIERPLADQEETREHQLKASYRLPRIGQLSSTVELMRADREGRKTYDPNAMKVATRTMFPGDAQNADGTQRYNMADRERTQAGFNLNYPLSSVVFLSVTGRVTADDYDKAVYGLQEADNQMLNVSIGFAPSQSTSANLYVGVQDLEYLQASSRSGGDWSLDTDDTAHLVGGDLKLSVIPNRLDLSFGYQYTRSVAEISHRSATVDVVPLPDLDTKVHTFDVKAEYHLDAHSSVKAQYLYEHYDSENWATDNIGAQGTDSTFYLASGLESPNHEIHYVGLTYKRSF